MAERKYRAEVEVRRVCTFMDEDGTEWQVSEIDGAAVPAARGERCLVFQAPHVMRRVWSFPASWQKLSAPELERLSWRR